MAITTLAAIIEKVRFLTGTANSNQLTNSQIEDFIDSFYLYDFPAQFRSLKLKDIYTFDTVQGIDTYAFNSEGYTTIQSPCFCMGREIALFNGPSSFYGANFNWQNQTNFTTGAGTQGPYSGISTAIPILRSYNNLPTNLNYPASRVQNILITANTLTGTLNVTDDGNGNLIGDVVGGPVPVVAGSSGTINYLTGQITGLLFSQNIPAGNVIQIQYNPYQASIPLSIMFYQNQFTLRPVPNQGYTIQVTAYRQPTRALAETPAFAGTPELSEWWETIAFGAAKKVYQNRLDPDGVALMSQYLEESYLLNMTRTYAQIGSNERVPTMFADQLQNGYGGGGPFGLGSL